jgi:hypothetical protein
MKHRTLEEWFAEFGDHEMPPPCQPIGCDIGYHFDWCVYKNVDTPPEDMEAQSSDT